MKKILVLLISIATLSVMYSVIILEYNYVVYKCLATTTLTPCMMQITYHFSKKQPEERILSQSMSKRMCVLIRSSTCASSVCELEAHHFTKSKNKHSWLLILENINLLT